MPKINQAEYKLLKGLDNKWKWIARDEDLSVYDDKPVKVHSVIPCWDIRTANNEWERINRSLFRFVQWGDEEPYSIGELIEEYEKESEETEVKKDKEWLKETILGIEITQFDGYKADLEEFVNPHQLEEIIDDWMPEVLSQEWIDGKTFVVTDSDGDDYAVVAHSSLQNLLVPKQELPVIPKYVGDWILDLKSKDIHLLDSIYDFSHGEDIHNYMRKHGDVLLRAWLDGYTIEKKQKYFARIKGWENVTTGSEAYYWVDFKKGDGGVGISTAVEDEYQSVSFTKHDWNNLGINEHNADFVLVEEME